jgi:UDP:flavonoid glycosyltransferase YjiC (YdhE family)
VRLPTYDFEDDELRDAVARLLVDGDLRRRMSVEGERIRGRDGKTVAADQIEEMAVRDRAHD